MVTVETIGRIRRAFLVDHKPIPQIVRELRISRKAVRRAIRGSSTEFRYERQVQPRPRLGAFVARLDGMLEANSKRPARERLTARRLFELLRAEGYQGAYDSVQRQVRDWRRARSQQGPARHLRQHDDGGRGGVRRQGAPLQSPFSGDVLALPGRADRVHPTGQARGLKAHGGGLGEGAEEPAPAKAGVENPSLPRRRPGSRTRACPGEGRGRQRTRAPVHAAAALCRRSLSSRSADPWAELNAWLEARCLAQARESAHPEQSDKTVWEVFEAERASLIEYRGPFDARPRAVRSPSPAARRRDAAGSAPPASLPIHPAGACVAAGGRPPSRPPRW